MNLPPFPCQDLAKLVLGYLAEEQLMTAYDEFLQASPYLDALRNEYDRIFMTSLKNILAEYRALKIYVETCKPFLLRKKLVQCANLLEVVKMLVSYIDINKLQSQDATIDKVSISQNKCATLKQNACEVCSSDLLGCVCKSKQYKSSNHSVNYAETSSLERSVETTVLEDLPGTIRKKHARILEKVSIPPSNLSASDSNKQYSICKSSSNILNSNTQESQADTSENSLLQLSNIVKVPDPSECRDKIEEFNNILNKVCNDKLNSDTRSFNADYLETSECRVSNTNLQNFAFVSGNMNIPVPDSSTSDNSNTQNFAKNNTSEASSISVESIKIMNDNSTMQTSNNYPYPRIKPKSNDQKIKIISDIKVDSPYPSLNHATSTPLTQTIVINGTPAYKQKLPAATNNYTKDEIMAMPTIIVVPTSAPPQKFTQTKPVLSTKTKKVKTKTVPSAKLLPLVIDISSSPIPNTEACDNGTMGIDVKPSGMDVGLVKTVDVVKNASVPKDNTITGSTQSSTPQILPPVRKSSSTPRRNSHIRVLDFATPRRIFNERNKRLEEVNDNPHEIVSTRSNVVFSKTTNVDNNINEISNVSVHKSEHISNLKESSKSKPLVTKKSNWDADLRALAICNENVNKVIVRKRRVKDVKKKAAKYDTSSKNDNECDDTSGKIKPRNKRKSSPKGKKSKRRKLEEEEDQYNESVKNNESKTVTTILKPTFNIVAADAPSSQENLKIDDGQNKSSSEDANETPETERISLQNEIGAKLNISDLLETPYKQALYDIQMETPKFLGSMLPDEPISDIKIMNIPTPRFFDTPKPIQATPSYSSRATDYSSGGSYYKPDEQDYLKIPDLECAVTSSKQETATLLTKKSVIKKNARPVRKCTENVSYTSKGKGIDDKLEVASGCSDSASLNSSFEKSKGKENLKTLKTPKNKTKLHYKTEIKKKIESTKKKKSPIKRDKSNTFMKIKPRRPTPIKENKINRRKSIAMQNNSAGLRSKKRTPGKDKTVYVTPPAITSVPAKSRRKSSTPRKLHCTKQFNSESSVSPDMNVANVKMNVLQEQNSTVQDSDTEQLPLRWSDDGSQDTKPRISECEDISKIKEYIESFTKNKTDYSDNKGSLQVDLIKRGFDVETAKIIERDLLDTPTDFDQKQEVSVHIVETGKELPSEEKVSANDANTANDAEIEQDAEDDMQLSVYECNEESANYILCNSESKDTPNVSPVTLKETWSMELCIDDGLPIRLRPTKLKTLYEHVAENLETGNSVKETELAVRSILNLDNVNTPIKDHRTECYEIFDSTLTSLDTPLKLRSPKGKELQIREIEIVVEEEREEFKDKSDVKKRKRLQINSSPDESLNESNRTEAEPQYLFNSTNIQNIDIESVLKKLHGPS